ncbi:30S ribosomal protein S8 [candidate division WOR-3 bacterium]|nr:30S ribosomal protein S8 [candidate division WOR-3 bacterium]
MGMTDPIADMLTQIRNALQARHTEVELPTSRMKLGIADVLKREGYIKDYKLEVGSGKWEVGSKTIKIYFKPARLPHSDKRSETEQDIRQASVIRGLKRISKPGRRVYVEVKKIPRVEDGLGIAILSTSQGILSDRESRKAKIGGEVLAYVW